MPNGQQDFMDALAAHVRNALGGGGTVADYSTEAVKVVDARNHLFRTIRSGTTDEADDTYALRELCRIDEETLDYTVDYGKLAAVARNYF
ncbi:MAG: hypothetical protein IJ729_02870 [Alloprevotella sp.]|nr:hypothetical protein [Alloprevotella sp.]